MSSKVPDTKKPADTPFKQQRLRAWQPILSPAWVIGCFFIIAGAFIPLGALIIVSSNEVQEISVRYDPVFQDCPWWKSDNPGCLEKCDSNPCRPDLQTENCGMIGNLGIECPRTFGANFSEGRYSLDQIRDMATLCDPKCTKTIEVEIAETMEPPIYMYYKLTDFYQNHRRYAKSRADEQLAGGQTGSAECDPLQKLGQLTKDDYCRNEFGEACGDIPIIECKDQAGGGPLVTDEGRCKEEGETVRKTGDVIYNPCGLIAWSRFNDTFSFIRENKEFVCNGADPASTAAKCEFTGISWDADREEKYKKPFVAPDVLTHNGLREEMDKCTQTGATECKSWAKREHAAILPYLYNGWYLFEPYHKIANSQDEDFIVWMRTASLPTFRKLHRKITEPLEPGRYSLRVDHRFDVSGFGGEKHVVFSTLTWIGGKNVFLGIAYIAVGCLCFVFGFLFAVKHCCFKNNRGQEVIQSYQNQRAEGAGGAPMPGAAPPPPPPAPNKDAMKAVDVGQGAAADEAMGMVMEVQQRRDTDLLAYCVATLCAIDVVLCMRILQVRTVFGLVFSVCGLFGCATRKKSYVLMYVIHTSFTLVRGVVHTGSIVLGHPNVFSSLGLSPREEVSEESYHASLVSVFMLLLLEVVELAIAGVVYRFYSNVKDEESPNVIEDLPLPHQYVPADGPVGVPVADPAAGLGMVHAPIVEHAAPAPKTLPMPQTAGSAVSNILRRRKKKK